MRTEKRHVKHRTLLLVIMLAVMMTVTSIPAFANVSAETPAVRIAYDDIQDGDNIMIVGNGTYDGYRKAISVNTSGTYIYPADLPADAVGDTIASIPGSTAVFRVSRAEEGGGIWLECSQGYLSVVPNGNYSGLGYVAEASDSNLWTVEDGEYLCSSGNYAEYYSRYSDFTVYSSKYNDPGYRFSFYRVDAVQEETTGTGEFRLPVFETSDVHGCLAYTSEEPYQYRMAYISDKVRDVRGDNLKRAVLLDGGDIYQGEIISNWENGKSMSAAYDRMHYDAVTIGNHEFDWGIDTVIDDRDNSMLDYQLGETQYENKVPVVSANILLDGSPAPLADPYVILEKEAVNSNGESVPVKIAVIGMADDYATSIMRSRFLDVGYSILDMEESYTLVNQITSELKDSGACDAVILLAHGEGDDIAEGLGSDTQVDLVLGGHTHINVIGRTAQGLPYMEPAGSASAYCYTELTFDKDDSGKAVYAGTGKLSTVSTAGLADKAADEASGGKELDPSIVEVTDYYLDKIEGSLKEIIGYIDTPVKRYVYLPDSGDKASTAGNWSASILKRSAEADVAIVNAGGLRTDFDLAEGEDRRPMTVADIYKMYPFDNMIYLYELTYGELLEVLDYAMMTEEAGRLLSNIEGIDCYFTDRTITALVSEDGKVIYKDGEWAAGWKDRTLKFAVNSYSATTDRPSAEGVSNPLVAWNETGRLISADQDIYQNALRVLRAEAESADGRLDIDTVPHFINKECTLTITPEKEDRPSGGHGTSVVYYPVNLVDSVEGGSVSVNLSRTRSGQMVTVTANPDEGYRTESVTVTDKNDKAVAVTDHQDGTYSFIMPASGVTIEPVFVREDEHTDRICLRDETCPMTPFTDTDRQAWYHDGVHWVIENGIMHGTDENTFGPLTVTSRAMSVTTLWRMEGSPETDSSVTFEDVPEGMWYTDAVRWAAVNGIVTGYSVEEFCPADPVTREQLATILYRYVQQKGQGFAGTWAFSLNFSDVDQVSEYAYEALCWMTMQGIVEGMDDHRLAPQEGTDRAQLATILMRFDRWMM